MFGSSRWRVYGTDDRMSGMQFDRADDGRFSVCFVCAGNICRSPMAETVFRSLVEHAGLGDRITVSSAGTGDWHVGERADARTIAALASRGFRADGHRARQFDPDWFPQLDLVIAFDRAQQRILQAWASMPVDRDKVKMLRSFEADPDELDVPDPYYSDAAEFDRVLDLIQIGSAALFRQLEPAIRLGAGS